MINYILKYIRHSYNKNKLSIKSFFNNVKFFIIRDFIFLMKEWFLYFVALNIIIFICLNHFISVFSEIYRSSVLLFMLAICFLCILLFLKTSKVNKLTCLQISKINSETLASDWSKINKIVIMVLLAFISYFTQLYFLLNFKLFNVEPILAKASFEVMQGCFMYVVAAMIIYFAYQSRLFLIAYENKIV